MKKFLVSSTVVVVLMAAGQRATFAGVIAGSKHDMSGRGWGTTELCKFCHTPHLAQNVTGAPLWNHQTTTKTYVMYSLTTSASFQGTPSASPGATSLLCLSCHDGTVAIDSFATGGALRTPATVFMSSTNLIGNGTAGLTRDHPISFTYDSALVTADQAASGSATPQLATPNANGTVGTGTTLPLYANKMECATCHTSHDNANGMFLRTSNTGSAMCLICHKK